MKTISDIPPEILTIIFGFIKQDAPPSESTRSLRQCVRVNKAFCDIAMPFLWRKPVCEKRSDFEAFLRTLMASKEGRSYYPYHDYIQRLNFGHFSARYLHSEHLDFLLRLCSKNLRAVNVPDSSALDRNGIKFLTDSSSSAPPRKLEEIFISDRAMAYKFGESMLRSLFTNCRQLKDVGLYQCSYITDETIVKLAENCANLSKLTLYNSSEKLSMVSVDALLKNSAFLKTIEINDMTMAQCESLFQLARKCRIVNIRSVNVAADRKIKYRLLKNCSKEELKVEVEDYGEVAVPTVFA